MKILVIEDDPIDLVLLERLILENIPLAEFCNVRNDAELGSALAEERQVALLNYTVPGMDFCTTFNRIRMRQPDLPIVLISGGIANETLIDMLREDLTDLVFKDRLFRLVPAIRRLLLEAADHRARRNAEQALRDSQEQLSNVLLATREGIWDCDLTTGRVTHNRLWCEILGFDDKMLEHPVAEFFALIHPDDRAMLNERVEAAYTKTGEYTAEYRLRRQDGRYIWIADHGLVVTRDISGQPLRILGAFSDITERKQAQMHLERSKEQLHALAARLQAVREEERSRIAIDVHDGLGQLLTGLVLDMAWLGKRVQQVEDPALRRVMTDKLGDIETLTDAMTRSVRDIASDTRPQVLDSLGLAPAVRFECERFQQRTGIACDIKASADMPALHPEHATAMFRILQEILTNVIRHARASSVRIELEHQQNGVVMIVRDDGRGITAAEQDDPRSLGLLGMRERAAQFNGSVDIVGIPGQGTTVKVMLP